MSSRVKKEILEPGTINTIATIATPSKQDHINNPNIVPSSYLSSCSSGSTSSLRSDSLDSMDVDNCFFEQQFRTNPAKRSSNSSLNDGDGDGHGHGHGLLNKKPKQENNLGFVVPDGVLAPLPLRMVPPPLTYNDYQEGHVGVGNNNNNNKDNQVAAVPAVVRGCRQFWKAGDYEGVSVTDSSSDHSSVGMDHVRVHPKFLHSNATSHKWALGAFAELLDNALDEVGNGATCVCIDVLENKRDSSKMLLVQDDGGGMTPDKMRACMSLGYSAKSKMANTIGQYGNGFKTSTMRLGSDVIVFSRCQGKDGKSLTQSIGLLSATFLRKTGKEDIVVPMVDFEKGGRDWNKKIRSSLNDWDRNLKTILQWSPFLYEEDLLQQFNFLKGQGTRIIIYNLWEDDDVGNLELDFYTDPYDIQIRGVERDLNNVIKAASHPNSKHFFTYQHSLRSYAAILYLKLPPGFRIILRGVDVEHHDLVKDMMEEQEISYKPMQVPEGVPKTTNMTATGKIGFVKDAPSHIDVQGFSVYHKNRLIKPFWRVWNAAGSDGRGVIGVLEANFVEPAHDKQGFERTIVLSRLEAKLLNLQKNYWNTKCHLIGYAARRSKNRSSDAEQSARNKDKQSEQANQKLSSDPEQSARNKDKHSEQANQNGQCSTNGDKRSPIDNAIYQNRHGSKSRHSRMKDRLNSCKISAVNDAREGTKHNASLASRESLHGSIRNESTHLVSSPSYQKQVVISKDGQVTTNGNVKILSNSKADNHESRLNRISRTENHLLQNGLEHERDRCQKLESQLQERTNELEAERKKTEELEKDNQCLLDMLQEERTRQTEREDELMKKVKNASQTIEDLRDRVRQLERKGLRSCKTEKNCY